MGKHDEYGKCLFADLLGPRWDSLAFERSIDEAGVRADLDGVIRSRDSRAIECAVEIEARVYKQIRGAIVDLALHPTRKKLLVIIRAQPQLGSKEKTTSHCTYIWQQLAAENRGEFAMVVLEGTGDTPMPEVDKHRITQALLSLGISL